MTNDPALLGNGADGESAARSHMDIKALIPEPGVLLFVGILLTWALLAIFANFVAPHDPLVTSLPNRLQPPFWLAGGSSEFLLGTDTLGRDVLSRVIFGSRTSLLVAAQVLALGGGVGTAIGLIAGHFGGKVDAALMRIVDVMLALPLILFALLFAVVVGPATTNVIIAVSLVLWARFARVVRGEVLSLRESGFVSLARVAGASDYRIITRHLLPNVRNTVVVLASLQLGWVIVVEASLSFLGAGVPLPTPSWGSMIAEGRAYVITGWWMSVWPGLATLTAVMAFNFFGDWLRDRLDPRLRQI